MLVVAHDNVVLMLRYVLERLTEQELLALDPVRNCSVSAWRSASGGLRPEQWNAVGHLAAEGAAHS